MAKKLRTTKRKKHRKLRNTKRILGIKRYKGGVNLVENEKKETYKQMLMDTELKDLISNIKNVLKQPDSTLQSTRLGTFIDEIMRDIEQKNAEELKAKLSSVSAKLKTYETLPDVLKDKAMKKAQQINTELLK